MTHTRLIGVTNAKMVEERESQIFFSISHLDVLRLTLGHLEVDSLSHSI